MKFFRLGLFFVALVLVFLVCLDWGGRKLLSNNPPEYHCSCDAQDCSKNLWEGPDIGYKYTDYYGDTEYKQCDPSVKKKDSAFVICAKETIPTTPSVLPNPDFVSLCKKATFSGDEMDIKNGTTVCSACMAPSCAHIK